MASDYLLEIDGIKGESKDSVKKETIEVSSFSWGLSNPGSFQSGSGGGTAKANPQDLHFTTAVGKASPVLFLSCASGKHIPKATLYVRKAGGKQEEFYTIALEKVLVSSFQSGGGSSDIPPQEQFSLNYAKIAFSYKTQDEKGKATGETKHFWDIAANKTGT
jgi:type VI secretion system secreted protein Hcp